MSHTAVITGGSKGIGADLAAHAIIIQHVFQHAGVFFQSFIAQVVPLNINRIGQQA